MSTQTSGVCRPETLPLNTLPVSASPVISQLPATQSIDPMPTAMEHVLASLARFETKLEEIDRRTALPRPPPRPEPEPPYNLPSGWQPEPVTQKITPTSSIIVSLPIFPSTTTTTPMSLPSNAIPRYVVSGGERQLQSTGFQYGSTPSFVSSNDRLNPSGQYGGQSNPTGPFTDRPSHTGHHESQHHQFNTVTPGSGAPSTWDRPAQTSWDRPGNRPTQEWQPHSSWEPPGQHNHHGPHSFDAPRMIKMDPPHFDGSDASSWISRVQYYFDHIQLPMEHRLHYVVMLFDTPVADWIFNYRANNPHAQWFDFLEDVRRRFDPKCFVNYMELIAKLCQTGSLQVYNTEFESMMNRLRGVSETILLAIYFGGLQQQVRNQVKFQFPQTIANAIALALEFDGAIDRPQIQSQGKRRNWQPRDCRTAPPPSPSPATNSARPNAGQQKGSDYSGLRVVRLTAAEKAERTRLGLCWYCPEKWVTGHSCRGKFLAYMGDDDADEEEELGNNDERNQNEVISADISHIYALEGRQRSDSIELLGSIRREKVLVLVDTGSSHDFLHPRVAEKLKLPLKSVRPFRVYVGNGESLLCSHASVRTELVIQDHTFIIDLHILPIHGPDIILGMAWLRSLHRVTNDYDCGTIEFVRKGEPVCLKVVPDGPREVSLRSFATLMSHSGGADLFELVQFPEQQVRSSDGVDFPPELPEVIRRALETHKAVFDVSTGMPPVRPFDHKIHLLPNAKPVNVRPYRYPYFQKNEIERQVREMMESGIIRRRQSPFSSPVLLIRKKDGSFRFCIDYRALNTATVPDHFPIPTTDELFDELGAARFFTKLDLRSGYHQI